MGTVAQTPDLRVMIVEDQAILAMELEMVLVDSGCDVVGCAMDRASAFAIAERERPELALIDINLLDGMTGPQIAHRLVEEFGCAVVFLTANPEHIPDGFAGALGAVSKPFDEQTIRAVVAFARQFILFRTVGEPPRRFRLAPWLITPPEDIAPH
jgi:CheY-like chemotaxis protein